MWMAIGAIDLGILVEREESKGERGAFDVEGDGSVEQNCIGQLWSIVFQLPWHHSLLSRSFSFVRYKVR